MKRHFLFQYSYFFFAKNEVLVKQIFAQQQLQDLRLLQFNDVDENAGLWDSES